MRGPRYLSCEGDFVVVIDGDTRDVSTDSAFFHDMDPCSLAVINPSANTPASPSLLICFDRPNFCRAPSRLLGGDLLMIRLWCAPLCRETVRVHESWRLGRRRVSGGIGTTTAPSSMSLLFFCFKARTSESRSCRQCASWFMCERIIEPEEFLTISRYYICK